MAARRGKVGVLTFHKCINYGSYWQARCLVEALRARGHDAELLDHDCSCVRRAEARCALQPKLPERTPRSDLQHYLQKTRKFIEAIAGLPKSRRFSLHDPGSAGHYDAIVVGSDEVWNFRHPWYGSKPIFFGDGLKTDRLVSYAASFGNHSAWDGIDSEWAAKLNRFSALSVRDDNSRHLVINGTGREPSIVLDPCLQFPGSAKDGEGLARGRYALVYGYSFPDWLSARVRKWADGRGLRLVSVGYSNDWADDQFVSAGPLRFARLVGGAAAMVTNLFHGCVFALMHGKPWLTSPNDYRVLKIPDLATLVGEEQRIVTDQTSQGEIEHLLASTVSDRVETRIEELRSTSETYLDAALS